MITIDGLTKRQVELLDIMWELKDMEEYEIWKSGLSEKTMNMVDSLEQMVVYASIDAETENSVNFNDAVAVLSKYRG